MVSPVERAPPQPRAETVRGFWHGEPLNAYQLLCLRSFAVHGHRVELYSYDPSLAVPDWVERKDASQILPPERVLRYRSGTGPGGFAVHTNLFRYALLHRLGGWWADLDLLLLRGDLPQDEIFFAASGQLDQVSCNLVKFPSEHPMLAEAMARAASLEVELWAQAGQPLLTVLIKQHGLAQLCRPRTDSSPIAWFELPMLFDPSRADEVRDRCTAAYALDLHDEVWRGAGIPFKLAPPEGSYIDLALRQHDLGLHFAARMDFADAARWIEFSSPCEIEKQVSLTQRPGRCFLTFRGDFLLCPSCSMRSKSTGKFFKIFTPAVRALRDDEKAHDNKDVGTHS